MKIALNMIVRDEAATLEPLLASLRPHVDEAVIIDTGSTDATPAIARKYADRFEVFTGCNDPQTGLIEDFGMARNRALELTTGDAVFWCDGDDSVQGAEHLRGLPKRVPDAAVWLMPYEYAFDEQGRCITLHSRERLVYPRERFTWNWPVHECLVPKSPDDDVMNHMTDLVRVTHVRQKSGKKAEPGRNLRILRKHFDRVGESDVRALYYLGVEYGAAGDMGNAFRFLKRYVQLSGWTDEKCLAELELAKHYQRFGDDELALRWADEAKRTKSWSEPYWVAGKTFFALAMAGFERDYNFRRACHQFQMGWDLRSADTVLFSDPTERLSVHLWWNQALYHLGLIDEAIASCEEGLRGMPENDDLRRNLDEYRKVRSKRVVMAEMDRLVELGAATDVQRILMRHTLQGDFDVQLLRKPVAMPDDDVPVVPARQKLPGKLDIVLFLGEAFEEWTPRTLEANGMGGSETMAWEMAKRLAAIGHRVRVYGHCSHAQEGVYDGVEWYDSSRYHKLSCDVLITSRRPDAVDDHYEVTAKARILWVHDVHCGEALTPKRNVRLDRIFCLSNWHKAAFLECYQDYSPVDPDKVIVTRNGIDLRRFDVAVERNPHRAIYSSSPDRGLLTALECWPRVRQSVPDAELHVFYGFGNWEKADPQNPEMRMLKLMLHQTEGVVMHDRVNQQQLAIEMLKSGVWAYPTWWTETSCITAMEAQAAGLRIVTSPIAALLETCPRATFIHGDWRSEEYMARWTAATVEALKFRAYKADAHRFCLDTLAAEWDRMLLEIHQDVTERVVPAFYAGAAE